MGFGSFTAAAFALALGSAACGAPPKIADSAPHGVGYRSWWELDSARPYDRVFADGAHYAEGGGARPILVECWYPARPAPGASPMAYSEYLPSSALLAAAAPDGLARLARELTTYDEDVIADEVFGKKIAEFTPGESAAFDAFLSAPTSSFRDAPALPGRFPLVLYHAGYGSSCEDQSVWCERLAGAGYVVIASAYEQADGKGFNIDAHEGSLADFAFLIERASHESNVDATRVAGIGHSGGAHTMLRWSVSGRCAARAIVSLDTTQDYYSIRDTRWHDLIDPLRAHPERATGPMLIAANPEAAFELIDSLSAADRWYVTAPLDHDEFIGHGIFRLDHAPEHPELAAQSRAGHEALYQFVLAFLDAELKGDRGEFERRARQLAPLAADGKSPHVEHAPRGVTGPEPYDPGSKEPPTPRQLRPLLDSRGIDATLDVLRRVHDVAPHHPIFAHQLTYGWVYELAVDGRIGEARALHALFAGFDAGYSKTWSALCKFGERYDRPFALRGWRALVALEPENAEAQAGLAAFESTEK